MSRMTVLVLLALALVAIMGAGGSDVAGYRSGNNVWLLGAKLSSVGLQGFTETAVGNDNVTAFYDPSRTVQFEKQDTDVSVALFAKGGKLTGVALAVAPTEKPFKYLRKYYAGRLSGCDQTVDEADECVWSDAQDDFLILAKAALNDGSPVTLIIYVRGTSVLGTEGGNVQPWMCDLFSGH
jgi:hypothetical protein